MKNIHSIEFYTGSKEELLPGFEKDFPYIASRAELDTEKALQDGRHRADKRHVHRTDRASREVQASQQKATRP